MATAQARVFDAPVPSNEPIPAYKIVEVPGPHTRTRTYFDEKSKQLVRDEVQEPVKYVIYFPRGHSISKWTLEEVEAAGFGEVVPLIRQDSLAEINPGAQKEQTIPRTIERQENKK